MKIKAAAIWGALEIAGTAAKAANKKDSFLLSMWQEAREAMVRGEALEIINVKETAALLQAHGHDKRIKP